MKTRENIDLMSAICSNSAEDKILIHEERLRVNKETIKTGSVNINKDLVTERHGIEVPIEREQVTIKRRKVDERAGGDFDSSVEDKESIPIPIYEEQLRVDKEKCGNRRTYH